MPATALTTHSLPGHRSTPEAPNAAPPPTLQPYPHITRGLPHRDSTPTPSGPQRHPLPPPPPAVPLPPHAVQTPREIAPSTPPPFPHSPAQMIGVISPTPPTKTTPPPTQSSARRVAGGVCETSSPRLH